MTAKTNKQQLLEALIEDLRKYLQAHPGVADSRKGIIQFWLRRYETEQNAKVIDIALQQLIDEGWLRSVRLPDGGELYRNSCFATADPTTTRRIQASSNVEKDDDE